MLTVIPFSQRGNGGVRPKSLSYQHRTQGHLKPTSVHPLTSFACSHYKCTQCLVLTLEVEGAMWRDRNWAACRGLSVSVAGISSVRFSHINVQLRQMQWTAHPSQLQISVNKLTVIHHSP